MSDSAWTNQLIILVLLVLCLFALKTAAGGRLPGSGTFSALLAYHAHASFYSSRISLPWLLFPHGPTSRAKHSQRSTPESAIGEQSPGSQARSFPATARSARAVRADVVSQWPACVSHVRVAFNELLAFASFPEPDRSAERECEGCTTDRAFRGRTAGKDAATVRRRGSRS